MPRYTDKDKAKVFAELSANDGNIKRTARNTGMDPATVRRWRDEWNRNGLPETVQQEIAVVAGEFLEDAIRIRGKLLRKLEEALDGDMRATIPQYVTGIGVLSDKIRAYEAIQETQRVEHKIVLPDQAELKELFSGILVGVVEAARERAAIIEALEEPAATTTYAELPSA